MIDADDLALLATSFEAAALQSPGAGAADAMFHDLGWADLLAAAPTQGAAAAFAVLGRTGAAACLLDDVVACAVGLAADPSVCVALPAPHSHAPSARRDATHLVVDGVVSARADRAEEVWVPVAGADAVALVAVPVAALSVSDGLSLDPDRPYRRVSGQVLWADARVVADVVDWPAAVAAAQAALAQQLVGASRAMLDMARQHAVDRVQFGRAIASFQAIRHKLAEALVAVEGAAAVADAITDDSDPLLATAAKALAGKAALTTAKHAQQTLAGIGFTTDHPFHRFLKRVLVLDSLFGSARTLTAEVGASLVASGGAPRLVEL